MALLLDGDNGPTDVMKMAGYRETWGDVIPFCEDEATAKHGAANVVS